jgi:hypothetical protein
MNHKGHKEHEGQKKKEQKQQSRREQIRLWTPFLLLLLPCFRPLCTLWFNLFLLSDALVEVEA